ncbi:MAG: hypothetical protein HY569_02925 [Candidatus Magasanikbacteria bacterium]|nr:hypothetical protein [Candidatus Magasanikbacteria bacterium]
MRFVETHLTKDRLFHKPHKWFLAFLLSPIHFLELHYKNKYHLNFQHAKKLFVFDMGLLLSVVMLLAATIFWFTYNPTITNLIFLSINTSSPDTKIISGDYLTYTITYQNKSDIKIVSPSLTTNLPSGFVIETTEPKESFNPMERKFTLVDLSPEQHGQAVISGWFYGTPGVENKITAILEYTQEGRTNKEIKSTPLFQFQRGSVLKTEINAPEKLIATGSTPIKITLTNNGKRTLNNITLPLALPAGLSLVGLKTDKEKIENKRWQIDELKPNEIVNLSAELKTNLSEQTKAAALKLTPSIEVNGAKIAQNTVEKNFLVLHPRISVQSYWTNESEKTQPGQTVELNLSLANNGDIDLNNLEITVPIQSEIINTAKLTKLNTGNYKDKIFTINSRHNAGLLMLAKNQTKDLTIKIPILESPADGADLILKLNPELKANLNELTGAAYQTKISAPEIKIGTQLDLTGEVRYFTADGDQLGRGPLPPEAGKETKYWALLKITNTTSKVTNLILTGKLPEYVAWTNKSSVSHGSSVNFNEKTKIISWSLNSLAPQQTVGIYFELALTPTAEQVGTAPIILQNIKLEATDDFIKEKTSHTLQDLDTSLTHDLIGREKGVKIK